MHAGIGKTAPCSTAGNTMQVVALCWVHSVIGFGFFILQSWIPTYLSHLGVTDLKTVGALSALPWVVSLSSSLPAAAAVIALAHHKLGSIAAAALAIALFNCYMFGTSLSCPICSYVSVAGLLSYEINVEH